MWFFNRSRLLALAERLRRDEPLAEPDQEALAQKDHELYQETQERLQKAVRARQRLRVAMHKTTIASGGATPEGEQWVILAIQRILPTLAEKVNGWKKEGDDL
jgi:hypothetical protein